jgi:hypothetical protein
MYDRGMTDDDNARRYAEWLEEQRAFVRRSRELANQECRELARLAELAGIDGPPDTTPAEVHAFAAAWRRWAVIQTQAQSN